MEPTLRVRDMLIVDCSDTKVRDGIFAFDLGDAALQIKRLQRRSRRTVEVLSDNPKYKSQEITVLTMSHEVRIIGRVVWADRRF